MAVNQDLLNKVNAYMNNPKARAVLDMIARSEGTASLGDNGYNVRFGGTLFSDFSAKPTGSVEYYTNQRMANGARKKESSTASGRYQFLDSTWKNISDKLGLNDYSKESQDRAALGLMLSIPGVEDAINKGDVSTLVKKLNSTWTSLPGSVEGGKRHGLRSFDFVLGAYNQSAMQNGLKPVKAEWNGQQYDNVRTPARGSTTAYPRFFNMYGNGGSPFLNRVMSNIVNRSYADAGAVPFRVISGSGVTSFNANTDITDPAVRQTLLDRLYNNDPNVNYGLSFTDSGLRPTITTTDEQGIQHSTVEYPDGVYIDQDTGRFVSPDGSPDSMVEYVEPTWTNPNPPQTEPEEPVVLVDDLSTEAAPSGSTPPTVNNGGVASLGGISVSQQVDPNIAVDKLVAALGGDEFTREMNRERGRQNPINLSADVLKRVTV